MSINRGAHPVCPEGVEICKKSREPRQPVFTSGGVDTTPSALGHDPISVTEVRQGGSLGALYLCTLYLCTPRSWGGLCNPRQFKVTGCRGGAALPFLGRIRWKRGVHQVPDTEPLLCRVLFDFVNIQDSFRNTSAGSHMHTVKDLTWS